MSEDVVSTPTYGGGFLGFLKGTQSLANAFWVVGVIPAVILAVFGMAIVGSPNYLELSILFTSTVVIARLFAWVSILKCSRNTSLPAFQVIAIIICVVDILHKLLVWSIFYAIALPKLFS